MFCVPTLHGDYLQMCVQQTSKRAGIFCHALFVEFKSLIATESTLDLVKTLINIRGFFSFTNSIVGSQRLLSECAIISMLLNVDVFTVESQRLKRNIKSTTLERCSFYWLDNVILH